MEKLVMEFDINEMSVTDASKNISRFLNEYKQNGDDTQRSSGLTAGKTAKVWHGARCCWRWAI